MIYLDNAATTLIKPYEVYKRSEETFKKYSANAGRSSHAASLKAAEIIFSARYSLANYFGINEPERIIFTFGCTDALNMLIKGLFKENDHVITTVFEHNSVLRPLEYMKTKGISYTVLSKINTKALEESLTKNTKALIVNYVSNVNGIVQDMKMISSFCKKHNILLIIDCAQAAGFQKFDFDFDFACCAGHKGFYGPQGIGVLVLNNPKIIPIPLRYGGTGTSTFDLSQPSELPEYLESGTLSVQNIAALEEGVKFVTKNSNEIIEHELFLAQYLINELSSIKNVKLYSPQKAKSGVIALNIGNIHSLNAADILDKEYGICCRGGYHCAPLMHRYLNTLDQGALRLSIGYFNNIEEIKTAIKAINEIAKK